MWMASCPQNAEDTGCQSVDLSVDRRWQCRKSFTACASGLGCLHERENEAEDERHAACPITDVVLVFVAQDRFGCAVQCSHAGHSSDQCRGHAYLIRDLTSVVQRSSICLCTSKGHTIAKKIPSCPPLGCVPNMTGLLSFSENLQC